MDAHTQRLSNLGQRFDELIHAAFDVESAKPIFDIGDDVERRRRLIRIRAVIGRIAVKQLNHPLIAKKPLDPFVDSAPGIDGGQRQQGGQMARLQQLFPFMDRRV